MRARMRCNTLAQLCWIVTEDGASYTLPLDSWRLWRLRLRRPPEVVEVDRLRVVMRRDVYGRYVACSSVRSLTALRAILDAFRLLGADSVKIVSPVTIPRENGVDAEVEHPRRLLEIYRECRSEWVPVELVPAIVYVGRLPYIIGHAVCHLGAALIGYIP